MLRGYLVFWLAWLLAGCAHGGDALVAFPPTGDDSDEARSQAATNEPEREEAPSVIRARFRTGTSAADVNRIACDLQASIASGGHPHRVDVYIGGVTACTPASEGGLRANLRHDGGDVVLELQVPEGTTPTEARELEQGLKDIQTELGRRAMLVKHAVPTPRPANPEPIRKRRSTKWFIASVVIGSIGLVTLGVAGTMYAVGSGSRNSGLKSVGEGMLTSTAAPIGGAALGTLIVAGVLFTLFDD